MNLTKQQILDEAINIGERLLAKAEPLGNGVVWKSVQLDHNVRGKFVHEARSVMYSGCAGIALFLAELYRHTSDERYRRAAVDGMFGSLALLETAHTYALFTGRMSVALALTRIDHLDPTAGFKDRAVEIALDSVNNRQWEQLDLINGIVGIIVGLLHIHAASGDNRLLPVIDMYVEKTLQLMQAGKQGVRWDRTEMYITSICGYSHGASGFAYAFTELSRYFNNPSYMEIALQACLYETQFFNDDSGNWRDLRGPSWYLFGDTITKKYQEGDLKFFLKHSEMNAWCHGAPGVGLARLRMNEHAPNNPFARELLTAVDTTYRLTVTLPDAENDSPCLCHGLAGNAELLLETYRVTGDESCLQKAWDVAEKIFLHHSKFGYYRSGNSTGVDDDSLFLGNAGVGYFFLRLIDPHNTPSVLHLALDNVYGKKIPSENKWLSIDSPGIGKALVRCQFPQTLEFVLENFSDESIAYFGKDVSTDFVGSWQAFVRELLLTHRDSKLLDIFNLENKLLEVNLLIVSDQLLHEKSEQKTRDIDTLLADLTDSRVLMTDTDISSVRIGERIHLVIPTPRKVEQRIVSEFGLLILEAFENPTTIGEAVDKVLMQVDATKEEVRELVINQLQQFIYIGLLLDPDHHKFNTSSEKSRLFNETYASHE